MTFRHGKDTLLWINENELTPYFDSLDYARMRETGETTTYSDDSKTYISGLADATLSLSGKWHDTPDKLLRPDAPQLHGGITTFALDDRGAVTLLDGIVTATTYTAPVADIVTCSLDIQHTIGSGDAPLARGRVIFDGELPAAGTTGYTTPVDLGASYSNAGFKWVIHFYKTSTGKTTWAWAIETSTAVGFGTKAVLDTKTFSNNIQGGVSYETDAGTVTRYIRLKWTRGAAAAGCRALCVYYPD